MADNVEITPGTGATIAADEVSIDGATAKVQRVKPAWGVAGSAVDTSASNPMPVTDAAVLAKLTADPATQTTLAAILAKLIAAPATEATLASVLSTLAGTLATRLVPLTSASPVAVPSSATAVTLKASNASRRALLIFNDSSSVLYVKYGSAASSSDFTVKMGAGAYWEMPLPAYTGTVTGTWASADGNALVTEGT